MYLLRCVCLLILITLINTESVTVMARLTTVIVTERQSLSTTTQHRLTNVTGRKGGELTRLLCGRGQTRPRRTRLCSLSPPGRVDAACTARSWSPGKLALFLYRSNSESAEFGEEEFYLQTIY